MPLALTDWQLSLIIEKAYPLRPTDRAAYLAKVAAAAAARGWRRLGAPRGGGGAADVLRPAARQSRSSRWASAQVRARLKTQPATERPWWPDPEGFSGVAQLLLCLDQELQAVPSLYPSPRCGYTHLVNILKSFELMEGSGPCRQSTDVQSAGACA